MAMPTTTSADGTRIAYQSVGTGPAVVIVDGALCHRGFGPSAGIAKALADRFTVYTYDRRGRGESGAGPAGPVPARLNSQALAMTPAQEIQDLEAVIAATGGHAFVCGISSGAALALETANHGADIAKLALFEAPLIVDQAREPIGEDYLATLKRLIAEDRRSDAIRHFMRAVQVPAIFVALMRLMPSWKQLKAVAPTLVGDVSLVEPFWRGRPLPRDRWSHVHIPTLVMDGGKSPVWMRNAQRALAAVVPGAATRTLEKQTHMVNAGVLASAVTEFFLA